MTRASLGSVGVMGIKKGRSFWQGTFAGGREQV